MDTQTVITEELIASVCALAVQAGSVVMQHYVSDVSVYTKEDKSPVTQADLDVNEILQNGLAQFGWPILSEETKDTDERLHADAVWIIDPIDGTRDFIEKTGEFCIMIGLSVAGRATFGVTYFPATDTLLWGVIGKGAWMTKDGRTEPISVSDIAKTSDARFVSSKNHALGWYDKIAALKQFAQWKQVGSNGLKCGLIAMNEADVFFTVTSKLGEWDMCGPHAIIEAAGGLVTGLDGSVLLYNKADPHIPQGVLATNGQVHAEMLTCFKEQQLTPQ